MEEKKVYEKPTLIAYGSVADQTLTTPSGAAKGTTGHDPGGELSLHTS